MKRVYFIALLMLMSFSYVTAQKSSVIIDLQYRTKFERTNWGIGGQCKYLLPQNFRLGGDLAIYFPQDGDLGMDLGITLQYLVKFDNQTVLYPLAGAIISNHMFSADPNNRYLTDFGLSLGLGFEYNLNKKNFLNFDCKYHLIDREKPAWYDNYATIRAGYGFRF